MVDYLYHHNANTEWAYPTSAETDAALESARETLADFLNSAQDEIVFGANMTTLTFHLSRALGQTFSRGDEIVVTELDHHANSDPWRALERERGVCVRTVKMIPGTGQLDWDDFARAVNGRTKLVAVGAASNALGTINDIARAVEMGRGVGALVFIDAVHSAPHCLPNVQAMDCDFLACSAYKFYGPHVGVLYGRSDLLGSIDFPKLRPAHDTAPDKAETGTLNHEGIVGAAAAVDFLASLSGTNGPRRQRLATTFAELHRRGAALTATLWEELGKTEGVTLYGPNPSVPRTPTVAFTVDGVPSRDVARRLADQGVFVSHGDFYASTVIDRLGLPADGLVRAGCAVYTTHDEILRLVDGILSIVRN